MIETSSAPRRKSSATFGNLWQSSENVRKMFGDVRQALVTILENLWKSSESVGIFGKSSKTSLLVCLYNKQNLTCPLVDMNLFSRVQGHVKVTG